MINSFIRLALTKLGLISVGEVARKTVTFGDPEASKGGVFWSIVSVLTIFVLWSIAVAFEWASPIFLPPPSDVVKQLWLFFTEGFRGSSFWEHMGVSLYRLLVGFVLGCIIGIPIGFAMALSKVCRGLFDPIVEFMRPIPPLALIPLAMK